MKHSVDHRAPDITPAAAPLPRLEAIYIESVTSLDHSPCVQGSRPAALSIRRRRMISAYENRSSAYRLAKVFLTRFGTVSDSIHRQELDAPFVVELFAVGRFGPTPSVVVRPVECVAASELPTSASVERGYRELHPIRSKERVCPGPHGGIWPPCGHTRLIGFDPAFRQGFSRSPTFQKNIMG